MRPAPHSSTNRAQSTRKRREKHSSAAGATSLDRRRSKSLRGRAKRAVLEERMLLYYKNLTLFNGSFKGFKFGLEGDPAALIPPLLSTMPWTAPGRRRRRRGNSSRESLLVRYLCRRPDLRAGLLIWASMGRLETCGLL
ncbi:hypothetical protein GW17_00003916 [Ensete ventricosum]|nr:hypothetical protein GW17_00003916 [Ensete ventricosum]